MKIFVNWIYPFVSEIQKINFFVFYYFLYYNFSSKINETGFSVFSFSSFLTISEFLFEIEIGVENGREFKDFILLNDDAPKF